MGGAGSGSVGGSCRVDVRICMSGEEQVPRMAPGNRIVWKPSVTMISASEESPSRGNMSTRLWPVRAGTPEERTKLTGMRDGVGDSEIV